METLLNSPLLLLGAWILLAITRAPMEKLLRQAGSTVVAPFTKSADTLAQAAPQAAQMAPMAQDVNDRFGKAVDALLDRLLKSIKCVESGLRTHIESLLTTICPDPTYRVWRVLGSFINVMALVMFLYADTAQAANNMVTLITTESIPGPLRNVMIPLLISSAGTTLILGMMLGDFMGVTHFDIWGEVKGKRRVFLVGVVILNLLMTISCAMLLSLNRFKMLTNGDAMTRLPDGLSASIHQLAALSQSLVIIPLLITTTMLFRGFVGVVALYAVVVRVVLLTFHLAGLCCDMIKIAVTFGVVSGDVLIRIVTLILQLTLFSLAWLLQTSTIVFTRLVDTLASLLNVVVYPLLWVGQGVASVVQRSKLIPPPPPINGPGLAIDLLQHIGQNGQKPEQPKN
jgi:hypothetical protein